jgi:hypothetical protein
MVVVSMIQQAVEGVSVKQESKEGREETRHGIAVEVSKDFSTPFTMT